ncbi:MAG TPA: PilZ domain-containing protein, partial [Polyangia bacterium]
MGPPNLVRIRLRYADLDVFVEKFAPNVTRGGLFLASRNVHPVGSLIDFEIQLVNGQVALAGRGKVTWVKEFDASQPNRPYGMGVQFVSVGSASRAVLARLLRTKSGAVSTVRGLTGPHATLAGNGGSPTTGGPILTGAAAAGGGANGRAFVPIDTSVDLAAELGVDDAAVRF